MIAFLCNKCKKPIDLEKTDCVHIRISHGKNAITSKGQYGDSWNADLCEECFKKISPMIDENYHGGNKYLKEDRNTNKWIKSRRGVCKEWLEIR